MLQFQYTHIPVGRASVALLSKAEAKALRALVVVTFAFTFTAVFIIVTAATPPAAPPAATIPSAAAAAAAYISTAAVELRVRRSSPSPNY